MQPLYKMKRMELGGEEQRKTLPSNNEIELCELPGLECKKHIEKAMMKQRISVFFKWTGAGFLGLGKGKESCILCVNENDKERAEALVRSVCDEKGYSVKFIMKKSKRKQEYE